MKNPQIKKRKIENFVVKYVGKNIFSFVTN